VGRHRHRESKGSRGLRIYAASHYVASDERMQRAIKSIEEELVERLAELDAQNKLLEAQRLRMRTTTTSR